MMNMPELIDVVPGGRDLVARAKELMAYGDRANEQVAPRVGAKRGA
jgi:hypothetical protein